MEVEVRWDSLFSQFNALGGVAQNVLVREGRFGRGVFPIDLKSSSIIFTPAKLLVDYSNLELVDERIRIKDKSTFAPKDAEFIECCYTNYCWRNQGCLPSRKFLNLLSSLPLIVQTLLVDYGFVSQDNFKTSITENDIFKRFLDERNVHFGKRRVLAPVWDLINHSTFAQSFRLSLAGIKSPSFFNGSDEVLQNYAPRCSPIYLWSHYGFSAKCIVSYSIPFITRVNNENLTIECVGHQHDNHGTDTPNLRMEDRRFVIQSMPVGSISKTLPYVQFKRSMQRYGLSANESYDLFSDIQEKNIAARSLLIDHLNDCDLEGVSALLQALNYELELIKGSRI